MSSPIRSTFTETPLFSSSFMLPRMTQKTQGKAPQQTDRRASVQDEESGSGADTDEEAEDGPKTIATEFGGPEDFTEHLSEYMFGLRDFKKSEDTKTGKESEDIPQKQNDQPYSPSRNEDTQQSFLSRGFGDIDDESLSEPIASSTPSPKETTHLHIQLGEESPQLPSPKLRIPKTRPTSPIQEPSVNFQKMLELQAEIERLREGEVERRRQQTELERENEELRKENEEAYRRFEEIDRLSQPDRDLVDDATVEHDPGDRETDAATEEVKDLTDELARAHNKYEQLASEYASFKESGSDVVAHLKESLEAQKLETKSERNKSFIIAREAAKLNEAKEQHEVTIEHLRNEIESLNTDFNKTRDDLQETKRILQDVEDENDKLTEENTEQKEWIDSHREEQDSSSTELRAAHQTIASLRSKIQTQRVDSNLKAQHTREITSMTTQNERAISALKAKHAKDITTLRTALQTSTTNRKASEAELSRHHSVQTDSLKARIADLEAIEGGSSHSAEEELRSAIRVMNTKLTKGNLIIKALKNEVAVTKQECQEWRGRFEALETEFEKREEEWNRRIDLLFRDRDRLAKICMVQWGREECGKGGGEMGKGQVYRYRYAGGKGRKV